VKIVVAMDSFKGSLSAAEAVSAAAEGIRSLIPTAQIETFPLADGGEGTCEILCSPQFGGQIHSVVVTDPLGAPVRAAYGCAGFGGGAAVVEMASAAGLLLVPPELRNPLNTTTYGVGELISAAIHASRLNRLIICLGGSATNDGGAGALSALGVRFEDADGIVIGHPKGSDLGRIASASVRSDAFPRMLDVTLACDVDNPLCGVHGASMVFGSQKGASGDARAALDRSMLSYASVLQTIAFSPKEIATIPGSGAAGGLAAGLLAYFPNARIQRGIDMVLDIIDFSSKTADADLIVTGEGSLDAQTLSGKAIDGVLRRSGGVDVIALAGQVDSAAADCLKSRGLCRADSLMSVARSQEDAMTRASELLANLTKSVVSQWASERNLL
jgi:glycerate kinase